MITEDVVRQGKATVGRFVTGYYATEEEIASQDISIQGTFVGSSSYQGQEPSATPPMVQAVSPSGVDIFTGIYLSASLKPPVPKSSSAAQTPRRSRTAVVREGAMTDQYLFGYRLIRIHPWLMSCRRISFLAPD